MKRISLCLLFSSFIFYSNAQSLKKIQISSSGCSLYAYCDFIFEKEYSEDSSVLFVSECEKDGVTYGIICVSLRQPAADLERSELSLISYLDYLKSSFKITKSIGYGKGHRLNNDENTRGVLDYWEDGDKNNWKIKGWTNGKFIGVLYGFSLKDLQETKLNVFLDGFRFPVK